MLVSQQAGPLHKKYAAYVLPRQQGSEAQHWLKYSEILSMCSQGTYPSTISCNLLCCSVLQTSAKVIFQGRNKWNGRLQLHHQLWFL